jgi:hypothetical protein
MIMRWGYIRIAIFTVAFLVGTLFNSSGGQTTESAAPVPDLEEPARTMDIQCTEHNFTLVQASSGSAAMRAHFSGM